MGVIDVLIIAYGLYIVYQAFSMKRSRQIPEGIFIAKGLKISEKADVDGYIDYLGPKAVVLGIMGFLCGTLGMLAQSYPEYNWLSIVGYLLFLIALVLFMAASLKARSKFLDRSN